MVDVNVSIREEAKQARDYSLASPTLFLILLLYVGEGKGSGEANVYYLCNIFNLNLPHPTNVVLVEHLYFSSSFIVF